MAVSSKAPGFSGKLFQMITTVLKEIVQIMLISETCEIMPEFLYVHSCIAKVGVQSVWL
jgi:hypothetical protein